MKTLLMAGNYKAQNWGVASKVRCQMPSSMQIQQLIEVLLGQEHIRTDETLLFLRNVIKMGRKYSIQYINIFKGKYELVIRAHFDCQTICRVERTFKNYNSVPYHLSAKGANSNMLMTIQFPDKKKKLLNRK